jgi:ABC-type branched-subunit amino acid transport system substrate-binding protein
MRDRLAIAAALLFAAAAADGAPAGKVSDDAVKIGVLTDMTGYYSDLAGPGSLEAAKMAAEDFGGKVLGKPIVVVGADHQLKADVASTVARKWFDEEKVDAIVDLVSSSTALAVMPVAAEKKRITLLSGPGTTAITGEKCTPYNVHWTYNNWALANGTGREVVRNGGNTWYFLTADYVFGKSLEEDTANVVKAAGGKVLGAARHPSPGTTDFSSYLLQAQASGAKIIGLANAGADTINSIKQAKEFGITKKQNLAGLLVFISDVNSLGLENAKGMYLTRRRLAQVVEALLRPDEEDAHHGAGGRVLRRDPLPEGRPGRRDRRRRRRHGEDARDARERLLREERPHRAGRPPPPRDVPRAGEVPGGVEVPVGLLPAREGHPGGRGLPAGLRQVPEREEVAAR